LYANAALLLLLLLLLLIRTALLSRRRCLFSVARLRLLKNASMQLFVCSSTTQAVYWKNFGENFTSYGVTDFFVASPVA
jgi:hypothetical protein